LSEILSQAEIDDLLNALTQGIDTAPAEEAPVQKEAKVYDFRTANRFPKDQIRTLNFVFSTFTQLLSNRLTGILRTSCEAEALPVEECSFNEFNNSLPIPAILAVFTSAPMTGTQLMEVSPEAAYMILTRLFGGSRETRSSARQFSEIDLAIIERVLRQIIVTYEEAWGKILAIKARIARIETNSQFTQIVSTREAVAVVGITIKIGDETGIISICIPHSSVEQVARSIDSTRVHSGFHETTPEQLEPERIAAKLLNTKASLHAFFDETPATVLDIYNLQVGDVIKLNHRTSDPLTVNIEHIPKFKAKVGTKKGRCALQIIDIIEEEEAAE